MMCCWGAVSKVDSGIFILSSWGRVEFCMAGLSVSAESGSSLESCNSVVGGGVKGA